MGNSALDDPKYAPPTDDVSASSSALTSPKWNPPSDNVGPSAPQVSSDKASEVTDLSQKTNLSTGFIHNNLDTVKQAMKLKEIDGLQNSSPVTHSQFQNQDNLNQGIDDRHHLAASELVLSEGQPPGIFKRALRYLTEASPDVLNAQAMNLMTIAQATGREPEQIKPGEQIQFAREKGAATQPTGKEMSNAAMMAGLGVGAVEAATPLAFAGYAGRTALTIGGFSALNKIIPTEKLIPTDANDATRTAIEIADFAVKGGIAGGLTGSIRPIGEFMKAKFADHGIDLPSEKQDAIINAALTKMPKLQTPPTSEQTLGALSNLAKQTNLLKMAPDKLSSFLQESAEQYDKGTLSIPSAKFEEYFKSKGMNPSEEMSKLGATEKSGQLSIPTGKFLANYANSEHIGGLGKDMQFVTEPKESLELPKTNVPKQVDPTAVNLRIIHHGNTAFDMERPPTFEEAQMGATENPQSHLAIEDEKKIGGIPLAPEGIKEVEETKKAFEGQNINKMFTAESERTKQTARIILGQKTEAVYKGTMVDPVTGERHPEYDITKPGHPREGSTVSAKTLRELGLEVPPGAGENVPPISATTSAVPRSSLDISIDPKIENVKARADDWLGREAQARGMENNDQFKRQFATYTHKRINELFGEMSDELKALPAEKKQAWMDTMASNPRKLAGDELNDKFASLNEAYPDIIKSVPHADPATEAKILEGFKEIEAKEGVSKAPTGGGAAAQFPPTEKGVEGQKVSGTPGTGQIPGSVEPRQPQGPVESPYYKSIEDELKSVKTPIAKTGEGFESVAGSRPYAIGKQIYGIKASEILPSLREKLLKEAKEANLPENLGSHRDLLLSHLETRIKAQLEPQALAKITEPITREDAAFQRDRLIELVKDFHRTTGEKQIDPKVLAKINELDEFASNKSAGSATADPRLNPLNVGSFGGMEISKFEPLIKAELEKAAKDPDYKIFGKESWKDFQSRVDAGFADAVNKARPGDNIGFALSSDVIQLKKLQGENDGKPIFGDMIKRMAEKEGLKAAGVTSMRINPTNGLLEHSVDPKDTLQAQERAIVTDQVKANFEGKPEALDNITATKDAVKTFLEISKKQNKFSGDVTKDRYRLEGANEIDNIHAFQLVGKARGTPEDYEAIYHHLENQKEPLTENQKDILEKEIEPLRKAAREAFYALKEKEVPIGPDDYTGRMVAGRGGPIERMKAGFRGIAQGGLLRSSTGALRSKVMWALEDAEGNRKIVSIKGGDVTEWKDNVPNYLGQEKLPVKKLGGQKVGGILEPGTFMDKTGKEWNVVPATTKEIESNTSLQYHKNALITNLQNYVNLRKVQRSVEFMENLKASPEFNEFSAKVNTPEYDKLLANDPNGYRQSSVPQLRGYVFPNNIADAFDDFYKNAPRDGLAAAYGKINVVLRNAIFFNPLIHIPNILNHWGVERGVSPWLKPGDYATLTNSAMRAWRAVTTLNQDYIDVIDKGGHLLFAKTKLENLSEMLLEKAGLELNDNKGLAAKIGDALGYANPGRLVKALYKFSSKITWASNDIATLQSIFEKMEHGMTMEDAIDETGRHIPNYRVPPQVLKSRTVANIMRSDSGITMFGAYHYGALKSYGEMLGSLKDGLTGKASIGDVASTIDKIAALAIGTYFVYPMLDQVAQSMTSNPNASFRRAGASTFLYNTQKLLQTQATRKGASSVDVAHYLQSIITPSIGVKAGMEFWFGRDSYNGRPISYGQKLLGSISPLEYARKMYSGEMKPKQFGYGLLGIKTPTRKPR